MDKNILDVIIIGGGPAGLTASIYAKRAGLSVLVLENKMLGGLIVNTSSIENYPGGNIKESGIDFSMRLISQVDNLNIEHRILEIEELKLDKEVKEVVTNAETLYAKTIILATGTYPKTLGIKGEAEFTGKGVSYCATCDAPLFKDLEVFVVGGGDSALEESIHISNFAKKVNLIHRRESFRASDFLIKKVKEQKNINLILNSKLTEIKGNNSIDEVLIHNKITDETKSIKAVNENGEESRFGVFVFIGLEPNNQLFKEKIDLANGFILTDEKLATNIEGVFAAGDIRSKSLRQLVTATSDGATAAMSAYNYIVLGSI